MEGRTIIIWGTAGLFALVVFGYSCFTLYDYVRGPRIISLLPESGSTSTPVISINGKAIHSVGVTLNGAGMPTDLEGNFASRLLLAPGYNIMKVTAKDRYNRTVEKSIEITLLQQLVATSTTAVGTTTEKIIN